MSLIPWDKVGSKAGSRPTTPPSPLRFPSGPLPPANRGPGMSSSSPIREPERDRLAEPNMNQPLKTAVVIPAYNEEKSIAAVVQAVNTLPAGDLLFTPVVVNDCSRDTTGHLISRLDC